MVIKYFEMNVTGNKTYQNLRDASKAMLTRKMIALNCYIKKEKEMKIINTQIIQFKKLKKLLRKEIMKS